MEVQMKAEERREETDEEFLARLAARRAKRLEDAKPKLTLNVSPRIAEAVKAEPRKARARLGPVRVEPVIPLGRHGNKN
jgi:hypothetical protein